MAGLTRNPDDELIRVIRSLESRVQSLETRRSRPFVGGQALAPAQSYATSGQPVVDLDSAVYDSGGVVDLANNRLVAQARGAYLVTVGSPSITSDGSELACGVFVNGALSSSVGGVVQFDGFFYIATLYAQQVDVLMLDAGDYVDVRVWSGGATNITSWGSFRVTLDRLHDV